MCAEFPSSFKNSSKLEEGIKTTKTQRTQRSDLKSLCSLCLCGSLLLHSLVLIYSVTLHFTPERGATDAELGCRAIQISNIPFYCYLYEHSFLLLQGFDTVALLNQSRFDNDGSAAQFRRQLPGCDQIRAAERYCALDDILQLANITRIAVVAKRDTCGRIESVYLFAIALCKLCEEMFCQR